MSFAVYQITNSINGKRYIGYTSSSLNQRWSEHIKRARLNKKKTHFQNAILKHGSEVFVREVLFIEDSLAGAKETEVLTILDRCPEYNSTLGGDGTTGHFVSEETRELIRQNTPVKSGSNHPMYGRKRPDVVERNKAQKGIKNPNLARKGDKNPNFGKSRPEVMAAMRAALPKVVSEETRAKQSASAKKRSQTEEGRKNASLSGQKGAAVRWARERARKATNY